MATVYIPSLLRDLTDGQEIVHAPGQTVGQLIESLECVYPGIKARICDGDMLRPGIALVVGTELSRQGMRHPLTEQSEVHFLPAVSGG
jgi:molybdopterin synthase sulfur carrier subunit